MKPFLRRARSVARGGGSCLWFVVQLLFIFAVFGGMFYAWVWPWLQHLLMALYYFGVAIFRGLIIPALYVGGFLVAGAFVLYVATDGGKAS